MELLWRGCSLQVLVYYLTNVFLSLVYILSSLETKHAAFTKSLLFYPCNIMNVAWPMHTYNMYMQLHFYKATHIRYL